MACGNAHVNGKTPVLARSATVTKTTGHGDQTKDLSPTSPTCPSHKYGLVTLLHLEKRGITPLGLLSAEVDSHGMHNWRD